MCAGAELGVRYRRINLHECDGETSAGDNNEKRCVNWVQEQQQHEQMFEQQCRFECWAHQRDV